MQTDKTLTVVAGLVIAATLVAQQEQPPAPAQPPAEQKKARPRRPPPPGVSTPGVKREMTTVTPVAVFTTGGNPDWQALTDDAVWVSAGQLEPSSGSM